MSMNHDVPPSRNWLRDLRPDTDQEATFLTGLSLLAAGFLVAQLLGSILFAPLSLIVPGSVLTLVSLAAKPAEEPE